MAALQSALILFCLIVLLYVALIITLNYTTGDLKNPFDQSLKTDSALYNRISTGASNIYQADTSKTTSTTLLNGLNFSQNSFLYLFDSTPYASKGHIVLTLPCNSDNPAQPLFQVLVGQAPDLFSMPVGYIQNISAVPAMCVYHGQFGFGDPVTDITLKYAGEGNITLNGPYSVVISQHESYIPKAKSFEELQHEQMR